MGPTAPAASPVSAAPAGWSGGGMGSGPGLGGGGIADVAEFTRPDGAETPDAATFGDGVAVRLPDGSVVVAPNALAASAVRHALAQEQDVGAAMAPASLRPGELAVWDGHVAMVVGRRHDDRGR